MSEDGLDGSRLDGNMTFESSFGFSTIEKGAHHARCYSAQSGMAFARLYSTNFALSHRILQLTAKQKKKQNDFRFEKTIAKHCFKLKTFLANNTRHSATM